MWVPNMFTLLSSTKYIIRLMRGIDLADTSASNLEIYLLTLTQYFISRRLHLKYPYHHLCLPVMTYEGNCGSTFN